MMFAWARRATAAACLSVLTLTPVLAQTPTFALADAPAASRGQFSDHRPAGPGREKRFVDARGWAHVLVPAGAVIDAQTPSSADLRWREDGREVACSLQFDDTPPFGLDFAALQALAASAHSPTLESGILPPGVTVRERRMLTLGAARPSNTILPQAAAWRFESPAKLTMGMAYIEGVHGAMSVLCFRQDGADPLATIESRWRVARGFAE
jgi:hypothetical protein